MRYLAAISFLSYLSVAVAQQEIPLWPDQTPPFAKSVADLETVDDCWGGVRCAHRVTRPTLTLYPAGDNPKSWLLIMPGGGYDVVAIYHEGSEIAAAFAAQGISSAVLKYRVPDIRTATQPQKVPFADFRRAMALLRAEQDSANISSGKIGVVGFSASGHLAVYSMVHPDPNPLLNPDYAVLVYGTSKLSPINRDWLEKNLYYRELTDDEVKKETLLSHVNKNSPPAFLVHAVDDDVSHYTESTLYADALRENNVDAEVHLFAHGGHGFGPGRESDGTDQWIDLAANWIKRLDKQRD